MRVKCPERIAITLHRIKVTLVTCCTVDRGSQTLKLDPLVSSMLIYRNEQPPRAVT